MNYIKMMRPKHYIKNFLIFLPLLFSGQIFNTEKLFTAILGFICFSFIASTIYIINDIKDKDKDAKHNKKSKRPIASGQISVRNAWITAIVLIIISIIISIVGKFSYVSISLLILYFVLNICYSFGAKNIPIVDICILVSGFFLRLLLGASLVNISVSNWLYLTVISISFYLGLGKRRNEMMKNKSNTRNVLKYYNKDFLDKNMYVFLTMTIIFYSLWATDNEIVLKNHNLLIWTVPFVIILLLRYSMDIEGNSDGDPVEVLTKDKMLMGLAFIYCLVLFSILYII